eukprot:TRINITY_DN5801_c1_g1_i1.p1 TRINITY_DN5801_c1_g1~~TRINITY_DN5801_c1_g1_i1.p1  ORF type:complete len:698 (-),score=220.13 TRINITY_DN5801_c1_g1_i1:1754-3847(-)
MHKRDTASRLLSGLLDMRAFALDMASQCTSHTCILHMSSTPGAPQHRPGSSGFKRAVRTWFSGLTLEERGLVLTDYNTEEAEHLRTMYTDTRRHGGLYAVYFFPGHCTRRVRIVENHSGTLMLPKDACEAGEEILAAARLCDTVAHRDTLTMASAALADGPAILDRLDRVCQGRFLSHPCHITWDATARTWTCEMPLWFARKSAYFLTEFIAAWLERLICLKYFQTILFHAHPPPSTLPPIAPKDRGRAGKAPAPAEGNALPRLLDSRKQRLKTFWATLSFQERQRQIGTKIATILPTILTTLEGWPERVQYIKQVLGFAPVFGVCFQPKPDWDSHAYRAYRPRTASSSTSSSSSSTIFNNINNNNNNNNTNTNTNPSGSNKLSKSSMVKLRSSSKAAASSSSSSGVPHAGLSPSRLFSDEVLEDAHQFIETVYFSPLARIGTSYDSLMKHLGMALQHVAADISAMDLIDAEEKQQGRKQAKNDTSSRAKKKQARKKKQGNDHTPSTLPAPSSPSSSRVPSSPTPSPHRSVARHMMEETLVPRDPPDFEADATPPVTSTPLRTEDLYEDVDEGLETSTFGFTVTGKGKKRNNKSQARAKGTASVSDADSGTGAKVSADPHARSSLRHRRSLPPHFVVDLKALGSEFDTSSKTEVRQTSRPMRTYVYEDDEADSTAVSDGEIQDRDVVHRNKSKKFTE